MSDCREFRCGMISVQFQRKEDRFIHEIRLVCGAKTAVMLRSVEGDCSEPWPCSPPFQQIVEEAVQGNPVLFGVGLSGNGHWSCAVDARENGATRLDIACRTSQFATRLGSRYEVVAPFEIARTASSSQELILRLQEGISGDFTIGLVAVLGSVHVFDNENHLAIIPAGGFAKNSTHRWCYEILVK